MNKMIVIFFIAYLTLFGCSSSKNFKDEQHNEIKKEMNNNQLLVSNCPPSEFSNIIKGYINTVDGFFIDKDNLFYSLFFFRKIDNKYFTIWTFVVFPDYLEELNPNRNFIYYLFEIQHRKVVFIVDEEPSIINLLAECSVNRKNALYFNKGSDFTGSYDGSLYPQTYKYRIENDNIIIEKSNDLFIEFLKE